MEAVYFAENPEPRCPCILLLDVSGSMYGAPMRALNEGLRIFKQELARDELAKKRIEIAIVTFSSDIQVVEDFATPDQLEAPTLSAQGKTHMGSGIQMALDMIQARKLQYRQSGIAYYRPWVFLITDGEPQGEPDTAIEQAAQRLKNEEASRRVAFFAVGVEGANMTRLEQIAVRSPLKLTGLNFQEMFVWLSASMKRISQSRTDEQVQLPQIGWGTI